MRRSWVFLGSQQGHDQDESKGVDARHYLPQLRPLAQRLPIADPAHLVEPHIQRLGDVRHRLEGRGVMPWVMSVVP